MNGLIALIVVIVALCPVLAVESACAGAPRPPLVLAQDAPVGVVQMNDGAYAYYNRRDPALDPVLLAPNGAKVKVEPKMPFAMPKLPRAPARMLMDGDGELHAIVTHRRGEGRRIGVDRFIDIHHIRTVDGRARWTEPKPAWEGYTGAVMMFTQLRSGRLVVPFAEWIPGRRAGPPTGANVTTAIYSDDAGATWRQSPAQLTAPCHAGYNGSNYGACEPSIIELRDGRVWMLMRTQTGCLYESWSSDGVHWSEAKPSRFRSSTGPPGLLRLPDGRIVLFWNHCELPPRVDGQGVYGGRDALHAAISDDDGKTWRGFREIYRDPHRNETPPRRGDRGTAYPFPSFDKDGQILVLTGQGRGRRTFVKVDPDWLTATRAADDFSHGLDAWHTFKAFGPVVHWWRDRTQGAALAGHPSKPGAKVLHVRRPDAKPADGATWNFPAGRRGALILRIMMNPGAAGGSIALTDRMFDPCDGNGERLAAFLIPLPGDGKMLPAGEWRTVELRWNLSQRTCRVLVDGAEAGRLVQRHGALNGLSYLRLRSTAKGVDRAGFFVDSVAVVVGPQG